MVFSGPNSLHRVIEWKTDFGGEGRGRVTRDEGTGIVQVSVHGPEWWLWRWEKWLDSGSISQKELILRVRERKEGVRDDTKVFGLSGKKGSSLN